MEGNLSRKAKIDPQMRNMGWARLLTFEANFDSFSHRPSLKLKYLYGLLVKLVPSALAIGYDLICCLAIRPDEHDWWHKRNPSETKRPPIAIQGRSKMKASTMLLAVVAILGIGSAIWMHTQRNEVIAQQAAAVKAQSKAEADLKSVNEMLTASKKEVTAAKAEIEKLKSASKQSASGLEASKAEVEKLTQSVRTLEADNQKAKTEIDELKASAATSKAAITKAEKATATATSKASNLQSQLNKANAEIAKLKKEITSLKQALNAAVAKAASAGTTQ